MFIVRRSNHVCNIFFRRSANIIFHPFIWDNYWTNNTLFIWLRVTSSPSEMYYVLLFTALFFVRVSKFWTKWCDYVDLIDKLHRNWVMSWNVNHIHTICISQSQNCKLVKNARWNHFSAMKIDIELEWGMKTSQNILYPFSWNVNWHIYLKWQNVMHAKGTKHLLITLNTKKKLKKKIFFIRMWSMVKQYTYVQ